MDMTQALAGPYAAKFLGDLGAEVIKIESPDGGDMTRKFPGPSVDGESGYFISLNRNKKGVTLNLRTEKGKEIFKELVKISDVVLENFRPGTTKKLGLDYDTLNKVNSRIIYCALSGYGASGPYRDRPAFDTMIQALSGVMSIVGEPGRPPVHAGLGIGDLCGGMGAAISIVTALYAREKTAKGQYIDLSMLDMIISMWTFIGQYYLLAGDIPKPLGSGHVSNVPVGAFKAADGYIMIQCSSQKFYENLASVISKEVEEFRDLPKDERFNTPAKRLENRKLMDTIISDAFSKKPKEVWLKALEAGDVPFAPVNDLAQALSDPQVLFRNMLVEFEYPSGKKVRTIGNPLKLSPAHKEVFTPPPHMGEHNEEIICGLLGYSKSDLEQLKKGKVI